MASLGARLNASTNRVLVNDFEDQERLACPRVNLCRKALVAINYFSDKLRLPRSMKSTSREMNRKGPKIVIVGGGFGGLFTALDLSGIGEVTLINEEDHFLFKPMLY